MNIFLWVVQVLLALHTAMGAVWKFKTSEQAVASLKAMPHGLWLGLGALELLIAVVLLLPAAWAPAGRFVPAAAACIALEMLIFCGFHLTSGETKHGELGYWLVVAAICAGLAYARGVVVPL